MLYVPLINYWFMLVIYVVLLNWICVCHVLLDVQNRTFFQLLILLAYLYFDFFIELPFLLFMNCLAEMYEAETEILSVEVTPQQPSTSTSGEGLISGRRAETPRSDDGYQIRKRIPPTFVLFLFWLS